MDDSTDCSDIKLTAFSTRYYSHRFKTIKETFLCLKEIIYATADHMTKMLVDVNTELALDTEEFTGLATDTTNSMVGKDHSLKTESKKVDNYFTYII